jgi:serine/threonine-protein kinase
MLGRTIGKYRIVDKIGRGGMGTVYRAIDETLDRDVAIKVLNPDLAETEVVRRFRAEAVTLARLNHPGIATIYELFRTDADLLMVMEFVRGDTFDRIIERDGALPAPRAASLCAQVLDALGHAHRVGIVHRDLKPANLMVTEYGAVKIMDFGIARVIGTEHLTSDGYMMGTPAYMAPEQVLATDVDARADLYSIGVVLYRLLTGNLPFQADTAIAMAHKQLKDPPTPLRRFKAEVPGWCDEVLARALAKSAGDRYQTAEEFRDALVGAGATLAPAPSAVSQSVTVTPDRAVQPNAAVAGVVALSPQPNVASIDRAVAATVPILTPAADGAVPAAGTPPRITPTPARLTPIDGATVVLRKQHLAVAVGLLSLLVIAIGALAFAVLQRAAPFSGPPGQPAQSAAAPSGPAGQQTAPGPTATPSSSGAPPTTMDGAKATTHSRDAGLPPLTITGVKVLLTKGNRPRDRDATMVFADGVLYVTQKDGLGIRSIPYTSILSVSYSRSGQPLWNSPRGPVPAVRIGRGAFGVFRSDPHWIAIRTHEPFLVLRLADEHVRSVPAAFSQRAGITVDIVRENVKAPPRR